MAREADWLRFPSPARILILSLFQLRKSPARAALACCFLAGVLPEAAPADQDPNAVSSNPRHQRATVLLSTGRYAQAEAVLDTSVKAEPTPKAYGLLGYAREMQNKFATAEKAYRESLRLDTDFLFARVRLGIVLTKQKRNRESIEVLGPIEPALHLHPEALFHLCLAYLETGDPARAVAAAKKMEPWAPKCAAGGQAVHLEGEVCGIAASAEQAGTSQSRVGRGQLPAGNRPVSNRPDRTHVALPREGPPA